MGYASEFHTMPSFDSASAEKLVKFPIVDSAAPLLHNMPTSSQGSVRVFMRHCGSVKAEQMLVSSIAMAELYPRVLFHIITTIDEHATDAWIAAIRNLPSPLPSNVEIHPSPTLSLYIEHGLSLFGVLSLPTIHAAWKRIARRQTVGIKYQRAGAFAIDDEGTIKWCWQAKNTEDTADFEEGLSTLGFLNSS